MLKERADKLKDVHEEIHLGVKRGKEKVGGASKGVKEEGGGKGGELSLLVVLLNVDGHSQAGWNELKRVGV